MSSTLNHSYYRVRLSPHGRQQSSMWVITADFDCSRAANDSMRSDLKRCKGNERNQHQNTRRLHFSSFPFMFLVYFNITLALCAWMALIEFIFMINVFFSHRPVASRSSRLLFIQILSDPPLLVIYLLFVSPCAVRRLSKEKEELKVESSRLSFWRWIIAQETFLYKTWSWILEKLRSFQDLAKKKYLDFNFQIYIETSPASKQPTEAFTLHLCLTSAWTACYY